MRLNEKKKRQLTIDTGSKTVECIFTGWREANSRCEKFVVLQAVTEGNVLKATLRFGGLGSELEMLLELRS